MGVGNADSSAIAVLVFQSLLLVGLVMNTSKTAVDSILGILSQTLVLPYPQGETGRDLGLKWVFRKAEK